MDYFPTTTQDDLDLARDLDSARGGLPGAPIQGMTGITLGKVNMDILPEYLALNQVMDIREKMARGALATRTAIAADRTRADNAAVFSRYANQLDQIAGIKDPEEYNNALAGIMKSDAEFTVNPDVLKSAETASKINDSLTKASSDTLTRLKNRVETKRVLTMEEIDDKTADLRVDSAVRESELNNEKMIASQKAWNSTQDTEKFDNIQGLHSVIGFSMLPQSTKSDLYGFTAILAKDRANDGTIRNLSKLLSLSDQAAYLDASYKPLFDRYKDVETVLVNEKIDLDAGLDENGQPVKGGIYDREAVAKALGNDPSRIRDAYDLARTRERWKVANNARKQLFNYLNGTPADPKNGKEAVEGIIPKLQRMFIAGDTTNYDLEIGKFSGMTGQLKADIDRAKVDYDAETKHIQDEQKIRKAANDILMDITNLKLKEQQLVNTKLVAQRMRVSLERGFEDKQANAAAAIFAAKNKWFQSKIKNDPKFYATWVKDLRDALVEENEKNATDAETGTKQPWADEK